MEEIRDYNIYKQNFAKNKDKNQKHCTKNKRNNIK